MHNQKHIHPLLFISLVAVSLFTLAFFSKVNTLYDFTLFSTLGVIVGCVKSKKLRKIYRILVLLPLPVAIFGDVLWASNLDVLFQIFHVSTVDNLFWSVVLNLIGFSGFFIFYYITRRLIRLKILKEYF